MVGKLEMIVGPMRSNKTAELLRRIEIRRQYAHQFVLLLKPSADTKGAAGLVREPQSERLRKDGSRRISIQRSVVNPADPRSHRAADR